MDLMSIVMAHLGLVPARKLVATSANSSAASIWAQCPQFGKTCRLARGIALSATIAPSSGLTRSSRPQVSSVCLRILWRVAPEHAVLGPLRVEERHAHRDHRVVRARRGRVGEPLLDQLVGHEVLVDDHRRDERAQRLAGRAQVELHEPLDALGRVGVEQVERQPARAHQDQPADPVGVLDRQARRRTAAEAVAEQVHLLDAQLVEQRDDVVGREPEVVAHHRRLVGLAEARLVDEQGAVRRGEPRQRRAEVRPRRGARVRRRAASPAAGRRRGRWARAGPGLVVVERQVLRLGGAPDVLLGDGTSHAAQYIPGSIL